MSSVSLSSTHAQVRAALTEVLLVDTAHRDAAAGGGDSGVAIGLPIRPLIEIVAEYVGDGLATIDMEKLRSVMSRPDRIRNVAFLSPADAGKTTLIDCLVRAAGVITHRTGVDTPPIRTRDVAASLLFGMHVASADEVENGRGYQTVAPANMRNDSLLIAAGTVAPHLVHMIDTRGDLEFMGDVICACRVTDAAVVLIDATDLLSRIPIDALLSACMTERVRPVLWFNKLDRLLVPIALAADSTNTTQTAAALEAVYQSLARSIAACNLTISGFNDTSFDAAVSPQAGSVGFGAAFDGWGFTLHRFALLYAKQFGSSKQAMMKRLWGDAWYDATTQEWAYAAAPPSTAAVRGFVHLVLRPILQLIETVLKGTTELITSTMQRLGVNAPPPHPTLFTASTSDSGSDRRNDRLAYAAACLARWLPASDSVLELIVNQCPSPVAAQRYRMDSIYPTAAASAIADSAAKALKAMKECDANGPLVLFASALQPFAFPNFRGTFQMIYITRLLPSATESGRFYAYGRVFSGTLTSTAQLRIHGPAYNPARPMNESFVRKVSTSAVLMMGAFTESLIAPNDGTSDRVPAGSLCSLVGFDSYILKVATITTEAAVPVFNPLKHGPLLLRCAVDVINPENLPKLMLALKTLAKSDPAVSCATDFSGLNIIGGTGDRHLVECVDELKTVHYRGGDGLRDGLREGPYWVELRESITAPWGDRAVRHPMLTKSPNKANRLFGHARPLRESDPLCRALETGEMRNELDAKERVQLLTSPRFGWNANDVARIWSFGGAPNGQCNVLMDRTDARSASCYISEIKDSLSLSFVQTTTEGCLCEEPLRGMMVELVDVVLHSDAIHRGFGQMMPTARRLVWGLQLGCGPVLLEPVWRYEIVVDETQVAGAFAALNARRAIVTDDDAGDTKSSLTSAKAGPAFSGSYADLKSAPATTAATTATATATATVTTHAASTAAAASSPAKPVRITGTLPVRESFGFDAFLRLHITGSSAPTAASSLIRYKFVWGRWAVVPGDPFDRKTVAGKICSETRARKGLRPDIPVLEDYNDRI